MLSHWTVNAAITDITVPEATGNPTPTYLIVGFQPDGISFDVTTRVLSGTPTTAGSGTITVRATNSQGSDDWTVAYTISAAIVPLELADWSQPAATDLEFSALLERTESGVILYRNADRNGTDVPLEGDLNLGPDDTEISRIQWSTNRLILNDNDNPAVLSLANYFQSGGDGNDLTFHVQTLDEGPASFDVATYYPGDTQAGGAFIRFGAGTALPAAVVTAIDDIDVGDRWIVAATRVSTLSLPPSSLMIPEMLSPGLQGQQSQTLLFLQQAEIQLRFILLLERYPIIFRLIRLHGSSVEWF